MAKPSSRVVLNRAALNALQGTFVDAMEELGEMFLDVVDPPDATPYGEGLVTSGGYGVWVGTKKVSGDAQKPRAARLSRTAVTLLAGFGFPGRFQETGTINHGPQPFVTPAMLQILPERDGAFRSAFRKVSGLFR